MEVKFPEFPDFSDFALCFGKVFNVDVCYKVMATAIGEPCKPLTQKELYQIIKSHIDTNNLRVYSGTWDSEITIDLDGILVGKGLQKIDFKRLEQKIAESGNIYFEGEIYAPEKGLVPNNFATYILVVSGKPLCHINCFETPYRALKCYKVADLNGHNGTLTYVQSGKDNKVGLSGKNPSDLLKQIKKSIIER